MEIIQESSKSGSHIIICKSSASNCFSKEILLKVPKILLKKYTYEEKKIVNLNKNVKDKNY